MTWTGSMLISNTVRQTAAFVVPTKVHWPARSGTLGGRVEKRARTGSSHDRRRRRAVRRPALRDPDDDRILEVAVRAQSAVVTFNVKDFAGAEQFGIRTISPKEMLIAVGGYR
jgi:hypothetical protein